MIVTSLENLSLGNYYRGITAWAKDLYQEITDKKSPEKYYSAHY
jgi:hypothetical protein